MPAGEQTAYPKTIPMRTENLIALPGIADFSGINADCDVRIYQYRSLNAIYEKKDNQSSALLKQQISDKSTLYSSVQELEAKSAKSILKHHDKYISNLSKLLLLNQKLYT